MENITVLAYYDRLSIFHSLKPLLFSKYRKYFKFTNSQDFVLKKDKNRVLLIFRWFLKPDKVDLEFLKEARKKYDRIAFFNGNAGGAIHRPEVLEYVDLFYNKALFKDRNLYKKYFYGDEMFSEYYHENYGVQDDDPITRNVVINDEYLKKLRLSWNIGVTDFPNTRLRQRIGVFLARIFGPKVAIPFYHRDFWKASGKIGDEKKFPVHSRLGFPKKKSIHFQRKLIIEKIKDNPLFLTGRVKQKQFNKEIRSSKIILSPFGWGELCKRDFEAVYNRSLLFKPDMSHLETWPDIFIENETYIPFKWDLSDLKTKALFYLENENKRDEIIEKAYCKYKSDISMLNERFENILKEIVG